MQDNHFSGKPGKVREFDSCHGNVRELIIYQERLGKYRENIFKQKLSMGYLTFGAMSVYSGLF